MRCKIQLAESGWMYICSTFNILKVIEVINTYIQEMEFKGVHLHPQQDGFPTISQMLAVGNFREIMMLPDRFGAIKLVPVFCHCPNPTLTRTMSKLPG